jgi:hypothetical protein
LSKGTKLGKLNRFLPENNHLFNPGCFFDIFIVIELTDCISHTRGDWQLWQRTILRSPGENPVSSWTRLD